MEDNGTGFFSRAVRGYIRSNCAFYKPGNCVVQNIFYIRMTGNACSWQWVSSGSLFSLFLAVYATIRIVSLFQLSENKWDSYKKRIFYFLNLL